MSPWSYDALVNAWVLLAISIGLEVSGTLCLKQSDGMTRPLPALGVILFYLGAFTLMSICVKTLEVSTVYAIWSGAGTALIALIGIMFFGESYPWVKIAGLALIIGGVLLLRSSSGSA
ncbi:MAG: QacE family quaternary ammonium compound efflux SMR transporter [Proteobacteria bacterium]|nr:QacE family quaternary ammonium compound efflux SMR transporter [Pseudomonadota bacterium]NBS49469.1 QacE family quaternary ammonium compound efflux SMR transporter [Verrucomicrobiota bacterium]